VAEVFEMPLAVVLDPAGPERRSRLFGGSERHFYAFSHGEHLVWGVTAGILVNLREMIAAGD
jgi:hypothetical protein